MTKIKQRLPGLAAGVLLLTLAACGGGSSSQSAGSSAGSSGTDTANSEVAIGAAAGATGNSDGNSGVAVRSRSTLERIADRLLEGVAYAAAGYSCTPGHWTNTGTNSETWDTMPSCTIVYGNGAVATLSRSGGPWTVAFAGCGVSHTGNFLVGSGCGVNSTATWSTGSTPIVRTWTGPLGGTYAVTTDVGSANPSGWTTSLQSLPTVVTCTSAAGCPAANGTTGDRSFNIGSTTGAVHITGSVDGVLRWDHTAYTTSPLVVTGAGANRVIDSGTIVVEHNLAHKVFTTTFHGPLSHMANCAFPVSGSVTTTVTSSGSDNGKTETVAFTSTCGVATLTRTDGTTVTLHLSMVL